MKKLPGLAFLLGLTTLAVGQETHPVYEADLGRSPRYDEASPAPSRLALPARWFEVLTGQVAHDSALGIITGVSYDQAEKIEYTLGLYQWLFDYRDVWLHNAPPGLAFKLELGAGVRTNGQERLIGSAGMCAMYFPPALKTPRLQPYVEAGIGGIYTDFRREHQGLRWNFHPQLGLGTLVKGSGATWYVGLRLSHISNADLNDDNDGINAVECTVGHFF